MSASATPIQADVILLTIDQTCDALQMSELMVRKLKCRAVDPLPSLKFGEERRACRRFSKVALEAWVARQVNG